MYLNVQHGGRLGIDHRCLNLKHPYGLCFSLIFQLLNLEGLASSYLCFHLWCGKYHARNELTMYFPLTILCWPGPSKKSFICAGLAGQSLKMQCPIFRTSICQYTYFWQVSSSAVLKVIVTTWTSGCWMLWVGCRVMGGKSCLYAWALVRWIWLQLHRVGELCLPHCTMSVISEMEN